MAIQPREAERENLLRLLELARAEDLGPGDVSGEIVPPEAGARGCFVARRPLVVCGGVFLDEIALAYDRRIRTTVWVAEGEKVGSGAVLAEWVGPARGLLAAERVALNFFQRLAGVATTTRAYVEAVEGTGARIYDTRKTTPGWRELEKYAVRAGGGENHRMGLHDAVLLKDNHLVMLGGPARGLPEGLGRWLERTRAGHPDLKFMELEVDTLDQLQAALELPLDVILLDNMSPEEIAEAVAMRDRAGLRGRVLLEASGGIDLTNVRGVAEAGVERIAVGALTHSAPAADIALDIEVE